MLTTNQIIAIAGVATVVGTAILILVTLEGVRNQLWLQTFAEWTRRYLDYVCELPSSARNPDASFSLDSVDAPERERILNAVRMYVNLCSEEHYLHSRGKIDHRTWQIWALGMRDSFRADWFRSAWLQLRPEYRFYREFCSFFDESMAEADGAPASDTAER